MASAVLSLDPSTYRRHPIHADVQTRTWPETNCYVDVWVELLHALGHEPLAAMPFTVGIDFEGDQWTFFKFPLTDLYDLYGLNVQELALWRPLVAHLEEQIRNGRPVLVELDSYYLPDTAGTAYKLAHVKSTVAAVDIDIEGRRLGYFHGQGFHRLEGDDFDAVLRVGEAADTANLPPYAEFVKPRPAPCCDRETLQRESLRLLGRHLRLAPQANPVVAFRERLRDELGGLMAKDLAAFHQYSFATLRQCGACYELTASYLDWLGEGGETDLGKEAQGFRDISQGAKVLQFQLARAMARGKPMDLTGLDAMASQWERSMSGLRQRFQ